jgi:FkbM family methyltransferase
VSGNLPPTSTLRAEYHSRVPWSWKQPIRTAFSAAGYEIRRRPMQPPQKPRRDRHATLDAHVRTVLNQLDIDLVVDVGANVGQFGSLLRDAGYAGRIVSFEPVPANLEALNERAAADPAWTVLPLALGRESGHLTINVPRNTLLSSFLAPNEYGRRRFPDSELEATEVVEIRRLDEIFAEISGPLTSPRTYLKLDTQGWDLEVLAGAAGCLDDVLALQTEISMRAIYEGMPSYLEALTELERLGFGVTGFYPVTRDADLRVIEYDCVLVRKGWAQRSDGA